MPSTRTTVALPSGLLQAVDRAVQGGRFKSRNEFLAVAVRRELESIQREAVDREFEAMADDPHYRQEARRIAEEYGQFD